MSNNVYAITRMKGKIFSFLLQNQKAVEIHCDAEQNTSELGNIYIGKIKNIAKNIGAAFVEIAPGFVCHLALDDIKNPVYTRKGTSKLPQAGDELLVQVSREGIKSKYPSVTTNITLYGKYVLLTMGNPQVSVSSKLSKEEKARLKKLVSDTETELIYGTSGCAESSYTDTVLRNHRSFGWLIRTNAGTASEDTLRQDLQRLYAQYEKLIHQANHRTCFSCMYQTPAAWLSRLSNLYDTAECRILTDEKELYSKIQEYLVDCQPEDLPKLHLYEDSLLPMKKLYSMEHQLEQALSERVWLKSGGYLVIQPTEALTVVDVNTGKFEGGKKREAAFLKINLEAAAETARQIRLRNISGIVIVDFINMESEESKKELLFRLDSYLRQDPVKTVLVDMTKLSLVEITRMKKEKSLAEACRL